MSEFLYAYDDFSTTLLVQGHEESDAVLAQYSLDSNLERSLIPLVIEIIRSSDRQRNCHGN